MLHDILDYLFSELKVSFENYGNVQFEKSLNTDKFPKIIIIKNIPKKKLNGFIKYLTNKLTP